MGRALKAFVALERRGDDEDDIIKKTGCRADAL